MSRILWIAPNLNHYKTRFLNRLSEKTELQIVVLAGAEMRDVGHKQDYKKKAFEQINLRATKTNFQYSLNVYLTIAKMLVERKFDAVLMPLEKKHLLVIMFLFILKFVFHFKLVSYNHTTIKSRDRNISYEIKMTKLLFALYDKIIFYTEDGREWAVTHKLIPYAKAYFANNTLDTELIWTNYSFQINKSPYKTLLFIGRLIPIKRVDLCLRYFKEMKKMLPDLRLIIIGDGPEENIVKNESKRDKSIKWMGSIVDENIIAQNMIESHIVFLPGASGLSIVHAFCYGKPYVTLIDCMHGPELSYLDNGKNGLLLYGNVLEDSKKIIELLMDEIAYETMCRRALSRAQELSIDNWCDQIKSAISTEFC